jgi:DNA-binding IclR family transcriptional regulator
VGVAIRAPGGAPVAALSLSAIRPRMKDERVAALARLLAKEARAVEKQLAEAEASS